MEKKTLAIVCVVMLIICYFAYDYQEGKRDERVALFNEKQKERELAIQDSLNNLRPMKPTLQSEMEKYIESVSDINLAGYENLRRLYYLSFAKEGDKDIVTLMSGHGINLDKIKGYTRLGKSLVIYYGNRQNIDQSLFDESLLQKETSILEYYANQLKSKQDTLYFIRKYAILHKDTTDILSPIKD